MGSKWLEIIQKIIMAIFLTINDHEIPYMLNYRPEYAKIRTKWPKSPKQRELFKRD